METVLFRVEPKPGHVDQYFEHVARLRPILDRHDGLEFIERFKSVSDEAVILSHQVWRDEAAIQAWRQDGEHYKSQMAGRGIHFEDYRIRVSHVLARSELGEIQNITSDAAEGPERLVLIVLTNGAAFSMEAEVFTSVTTAGRTAVVLEPATLEEAMGLFEDATAMKVTAATLCRVSRDYGQHRRDEAPEP